MSNSAAAETTNIVGYFNGNRWPIQLVISKLSITLHLQPGEYILDRLGRKVNDPFFEVYANSKQLQRETVDKPVPVIRVPVAAATVTPRHDGHSVRSVTRFKEDEKGIRRPVMPKPLVTAEQPINKPSVIGMSMQEARKAGLARRTIEVPEEYGVTDTEGSPISVSEAPPIKYARDTSRTKAPDLPKQLTEEVPEPRKALVQQLEKGATTNKSLDSATGFMNTVIQTAPPDAPVLAGTPTPEGSVDTGGPLPEPEVTEPSVPEPPIEESGPTPIGDEPPPLMGGRSQAEPYGCLLCPDMKGFRFRSQLKKHAEQKHPDSVQKVMAPYPAAV
jgi:hypothetical protein